MEALCRNKDKTGELGFYLGIQVTVAPWVLSLEKGSSSTRASEGPRGWVQSLSLSFIQSLAISAICSLPSLAGSAGYKTSLAKGSTEDLGVHNSDVPRGLLCQ